MDKIKTRGVTQRKGDWIAQLISKVNELVEGYNEIMKIIKGDKKIMENINRIMEHREAIR